MEKNFYILVIATFLFFLSEIWEGIVVCLYYKGTGKSWIGSLEQI